MSLLTLDNRIKKPGRMFHRLAGTYRGKPVVIPAGPLPSPPTERSDDATWQWLLEWMNWKK